MKILYDKISCQLAYLITKKYSTSFSMAVSLLDKSIRKDIYNIYGFVRIADEIVDSFDGYKQKELLDRFEAELWFGIREKISTNPVIQAFQETVNLYNIPHNLITAFVNSMRADLTKKVYNTQQEIDMYIYGSADVVGLMCLKIFVKGDDNRYNELRDSAIKLGSAFQKVNFLRDLKQDSVELERTYFPNIDPQKLTEHDKNNIIKDIESDFKLAHVGIQKLPIEAKFGVYLAYIYYSNLLKKLKITPAFEIKERRIRVSNPNKIYLLIKSFIYYKFRMI